jgi:hypothetical protein
VPFALSGFHLARRVEVPSGEFWHRIGTTGPNDDVTTRRETVVRTGSPPTSHVSAIIPSDRAHARGSRAFALYEPRTHEAFRLLRQGSWSLLVTHI